MNGTIIAAFLLGLFGSLGHCVGMCTGVMLVLTRAGATTPSARLALHMGRIGSYTLLGLIAGSTGLCVAGVADIGQIHSHNTVSSLAFLRGALALLFAAPMIYTALALLGRVPAPELLFAGMTRAWGRRIRALSFPALARSGLPALWLGGMLWGLLPCGLVLTALLTAMITLSPWHGALTMLAFGLGTLPALLAAEWFARRPAVRRWPRYAAAGVIGVFGVQLLLRGCAAWGWVDHLHVQGVMLW